MCDDVALSQSEFGLQRVETLVLHGSDVSPQLDPSQAVEDALGGKDHAYTVVSADRTGASKVG